MLVIIPQCNVDLVDNHTENQNIFDSLQIYTYRSTPTPSHGCVSKKRKALEKWGGF